MLCGHKELVGLGGAMGVYRIDSAQLEPPPEEERTAREWMEDCTHCKACQRAYLMGIDREHRGWIDDAARLLRCQECEEWE